MAVEDYQWSAVVVETTPEHLVRKHRRKGRPKRKKTTMESMNRHRLRMLWRQARKRYYQRHPERVKRINESYQERHKERLEKHYRQKRRKKVLTGEAKEEYRKKKQKEYQKLINSGYIRIVNGRRYYWWKYVAQLIGLNQRTFKFYQSRRIIPRSLYLIKQRRCFSEKQLQMMRIAFKKNRRKLKGKKGFNEWSKGDVAKYLFENWRAYEDPEVLGDK